MGTTVQMLREWFDEGVEEKATHMIIVCDTFEYEDYPVFVKEGDSVRSVAARYDGQNMQRIMEVYNLRMDKESQFVPGKRTFNY